MPVKYSNVYNVVLHQLESQLAPHFYYHNVSHTFEEVLSAAETIGYGCGLNEQDMCLLRTASIFHDIGFTRQTKDHEAIGVGIVREALPLFDYTTSEIEMIAQMIMATKLPQAPQSLLDQILADADLSVLGSTNFDVRNNALRRELSALGQSSAHKEWFSGQLHFLQSHHYFTAPAIILYHEQKEKNIDFLKQQLFDMS